MKQKELISLLEHKRKKKERNSNIRFVLIFLIGTCILYNYKDDPSLERVFIFIIFSFGIVFFLNFLINLNRQLGVKRWLKVKCVIVDKKYEKKYGAILFGITVKFMPLIYFSYYIDGKEYISEKLRLFPIYYSKEFKTNEKLEEYTLQHRYECLVNPKNPNLAILENKISWNSILFPLFFSIFLIIVTVIDM